MLTRVRHRNSGLLGRSGTSSHEADTSKFSPPPPAPLPPKSCSRINLFAKYADADTEAEEPELESRLTISQRLSTSAAMSSPEAAEVKALRKQRRLLLLPLVKGKKRSSSEVTLMAKEKPNWVKHRNTTMTLEEYKAICQDIRSTITKDSESYYLKDEALWKLFTVGFRVCVLTLDSEYLEFEGCDICEEMKCICPQFAQAFTEVINLIKKLDLVQEITGPYLVRVLRKQFEFYVEKTCLGNYETRHMDKLNFWLEVNVLPWAGGVLSKVGDFSLSEEFDAVSMSLQLGYILMEIVGKTIINEMFSVIIEFPESQPILDDLRDILKKTTLRKTLVEKLTSELKRRLLNAGVNTTDVLEAYVATVRALKYLDSSGILVQLITPPVRDYLKQRDETVRVILISLTEECGELAEELAKNPLKTDERLVMERNWKSWRPDPVDVPRDKHNLRKSDLIQALISIYGSKSLFIDEYRALLADRLLKMPRPGSITREIKCLELLKLRCEPRKRFGESDLQRCEVMLKDVSDSFRMNTRFYEKGAALDGEELNVTALIVSAQFWPGFKQENILLPEVVTKAFEKYTRAFEMIKGNRSLEWQRHIGHVEIEIEHDGSKLKLSVAPPHAVIIWQFQEKESWTLEELSKVTGMKPATIRNRIGFWISKGIVAQGSNDIYYLQESFNPEDAEASGRTVRVYTEEEDIDSPMTSTSTQREAELQMFSSYIEGMLTNLDSLPLSRIHSMLKLFATVECSLEELQKFLDSKVSSGALMYCGGQYQLPK